MLAGAVQVTSSVVSGAASDAVTAGASGWAGASSTSVTLMVTLAMTVSSPSAAVTLTVWDGSASWSSSAPSATWIWPVAASMVNALEPESEYVSGSPLSLSRVTGAPTSVPAGEFSATDRAPC